MTKRKPDHRGQHTDACPHCRNHRNEVAAHQRATGATLLEAVRTVDAEANARLIAAAPDLLELLKQMPDFDKCWCPELDVKRAAIEDGFCPGCQARAKVAEVAGENQ